MTGPAAPPPRPSPAALEGARRLLFTSGRRSCTKAADKPLEEGLRCAVATFRYARSASSLYRRRCDNLRPFAVLDKHGRFNLGVRHDAASPAASAQPDFIPQLLANEGYVGGIQLIDGSFVENVEMLASRDPGDIDVFSILNVPPKYVTDSAAWQTEGLPFWQAEIADRVRNKTRFKLDTYAVLFEELQARPMSLIGDIIYWYSVFSHQRETFAWKGFAGLALDPIGDQAALASLGSA